MTPLDLANHAERPRDPGSNVRFLRPLAHQPRDLDPAVPADPARAAERFLAERGLDRHFTPTSCWPIFDRSNNNGASVNTQPLHSTDRPTVTRPAGRKR